MNATYRAAIMRLALVVVLLVAGCTDDVATQPDAGVVFLPPPPPAGCPAPQPDQLWPPGFYGEACTEAPYPAITTCHAGTGWCVAGVCRPSCMTCRRCDRGTQRYSDRGACYCDPD